MTPAQFKAKWPKFSGKESAAYQEHFNDLCRMLDVPTPIEADPTGCDTFCFQKHVAKDAELFDFDAAGIGSFTTDLSIADFDAGADGDCIANPQQTSYKVGIIAGFEQPLLQHLCRRHGFAVTGLTFEDREAIKRAFALGESYVLTLPGNQNIKLGDETDKQVAQRIADDLANRVWESYREKTAQMQVKYMILTGGGSAAPLVRDAVRARFSGEKITWIDLDGMETKTGENGHLRRWPDTGETLARLATAVGAASVILDLPKSNSVSQNEPTKHIESP